MNRLKKLLICMLILTLGFSTVMPAEVEAASSMKLYVAGTKKTYTGVQWKVNYKGNDISLSGTPGLTINGVGMVPYYACLVKGGPKMKYGFKGSTRTLTLIYGSKTLKLTENSKTAYLNGAKKTLGAAMCTVKYPNGKSLLVVPIKSICSLMGMTYSYSSSAKTIYINKPKETSTQATTFKNMSTAQFIAKIGPLAQADAKKSGVMASVTIAQAILESGWGKSTLAQKANNLFGMKTSLSGNTWAGSTWDGKSKYTITTAEYTSSNKKYYTSAAFRKYASIEKSIADHSAYLTHARNGSALRYKGLTAAKTYTKQLQIIKNGGYATSSTYVSQLCKVITTYKLNKWD